MGQGQPRCTGPAWPTPAVTATTAETAQRHPAKGGVRGSRALRGTFSSFRLATRERGTYRDPSHGVNRVVVGPRVEGWRPPRGPQFFTAAWCKGYARSAALRKLNFLTVVSGDVVRRHMWRQPPAFSRARKCYLCEASSAWRKCIPCERWVCRGCRHGAGRVWRCVRCPPEALAEVLRAWREQEKAEYLARTVVRLFPRHLVIAPVDAAPHCSRAWSRSRLQRVKRRR